MLWKLPVFVFFLVFSVEYATSNALGTKNVCSTSSCNDEGELLSKNIDQGLDPCQDFYKFSCNNYIQSQTIPDGEIEVGHTPTLQRKIRSQLKGLLEEKVDPNEPRIFGLAKNYYKSCMDESGRKRNLEALKKIIKRLGGWPVLEGSGWKEETFDVFEVESKIGKLGTKTNRILKVEASLDLSNTSRSLLSIGPPDTLLDKNYTSGKPLTNIINKAYHNCMVDIAVLLGANRETARVDLKKIIFFEISFQKDISHKPEPPYINLQKIEDLYKFGDGNFPWLEYINDVTGPTVRSDNHSSINVVSSDFLHKITDSLNKTEKRTIANYLIWRVVRGSTMFLPKEYTDKFQEFLKIHSRMLAYPQSLPRWEECLALVTDQNVGLSVAASSMYVRRYFRDETRKQVEPIFQYLADAFRETVNKTSWLSAQERATVLKKLETMRRFIAYPEELLNDRKLDEYSRSLEIVPNDSYQSLMNLVRFHHEFELSNLNQATSEHIWTIFSDSFRVNAFYHTYFNYYIVLAGLLQSPLYDPEWPSYATFGGIGFSVGHEIMHAFDQNSVLKKVPGVLTGWLEDTSKKIYKHRIECLYDQYYNITRKESIGKTQGGLSLNENLADNTGLKIAYRAYRNWVAKYGEDPRPVKLQNYTSDQLFFISSMNFFCKKTTLTRRRDELLIDPHLPSDIRARGMISNSEEFARAFNCPVDSTMNPRKKCAVWD